MPRGPVPITGEVLRWAREESGLSEEDVAERVGVSVDEFLAWESGDDGPSRGQFTKLVGLLKRPSALFFMAEPPLTSALPTSLRAAPGLRDHELKPEELQQIRWARRLQRAVSWVRGTEDSIAVPLARYDADRRTPESAAAAERDRLGVSVAEQVGWSDAHAAIRKWRDVLESSGLLVFQLELKQDGIRGFSASDDYAPLVAVNSAYHVSNRIYTLFHELGHLVTGTESACIGWARPTSSDPGLERWCEEFAAAFLLPRAAVINYAQGSGLEGYDLARRVAGRFKVSTRASALRLEEVALESDGFYERVVTRLAETDWNPKTKGGRGDPTPVKRFRQFGTAAELLLEAEESGSLSRRDLTDYLSMTSGQVDDLEALIARRGQVSDE